MGDFGFNRPSNNNGGNSGTGDGTNVDLSSYAKKNNAKFNGSVSMGRNADSDVGVNSTAMGDNVEASGDYSHAEGDTTKASEISSHAEGHYTEASGAYSHAEGNYTTASGENQHVQGKYNIEDTEGKYAHIVGNGDENARSNAHTLDWDGNAWFSGNVSIGADNKELATKEYVDGVANNTSAVGVKEYNMYNTTESIFGKTGIINIEEMETCVRYGMTDFQDCVTFAFVIPTNDAKYRTIAITSANELFHYYVSERWTDESGDFIVLRTTYTDYVINVADKSTQNSVTYEINDRIDYLTLNRTKEYIPKTDYNPATKKYVDDAIEGVKYAEELITVVSEEQVTEIYNATSSYYDECVNVPTLNLQADKWYMIELYGKTAMAQARIVTEDDYDYESRVIANGTSVILDFKEEGFGWYKENNQIVPYNRIVDKQRCEGDGGHNNYFEDETVTSICFARDLIWGIQEEYPDNYEDISSDFKLYEILNYNSIPSSALQSNINIRESLSINNKPVATKEYIEQAIASMFTFLDDGILKVTLNGQTYYYSPMDV